MRKLSTKQRYYWAGFLIIVIIYSVYNLCLVDVSYYQNIPRKLRHVLKFFAILSIYGTGTIALKKYTVDWMMFVWHLVHIVIISLLLLIGLYDWGLGAISAKLRNIADTLFEFLISPAIFIGVGILNNTFNKEALSTES